MSKKCPYCGSYNTETAVINYLGRGLLAVRFFVLSAAILLTCTSCDVMLYALAYSLGSAASAPSTYSTYTTPSYGSSTYAGSSYTSSSSNSSSSARQSDMYFNTYRRYESQAQSCYNSYQREKSSSYSSAVGLTGFSSQFHSAQREMRRVREEARREGVNIPMSSWENMSL